MKVRTFAALLFGPLTIATVIVCFAGGSGARDSTAAQTESQTRYQIWSWDQRHSPRWEPMITVVGFGMVVQRVAALNRSNNKNGTFFTFTTGEKPLLTPDGNPLSAQAVDDPRPLDAGGSVRSIRPAATQQVVYAADVRGRQTRAQQGVVYAAEVRNREPGTQQARGRRIPPQEGAQHAGARSARGGKSARREGGARRAAGVARVAKLYQVTHDFGVVAANAQGNHVFTFENRGSAPLVLELADKSCGCTGVKLNGQEMDVEFAPPPDMLFEPLPMDLEELFDFPPRDDPAAGIPAGTNRNGTHGAAPPPSLPKAPAQHAGSAPPARTGLSAPHNRIRGVGGGTATKTRFAEPPAGSNRSAPPIPDFEPVELSALLETVDLNEEGTIEPEDDAEAAGSAPATENVRIAPGKEARLEVSWKVGENYGPFAQSITLKTSDPKRPELTFRVRGQVARRIETSADFITIENAQVDRRSTATFRVFSRLEDDFQLAEVSSSNPAVRINYRPLGDMAAKPKSIRSGFEVTLEVPAGQPIGPFGALVTLQPADREIDPLVVPVNGYVVGAITVGPIGLLDLPIVRRGSTSTQGAYLKIKTDRPVKFMRALADPAFVQVSVKHWNDVKDGYQYAIVEATLPADAPVGELAGSIELEVGEPVGQRVRIPLFGRVIE